MNLSLGDYSNKVVTSKWVKDVSTAAVYVSPSGNDSNSGMTAAESVATFSRAVEIGKTLLGKTIKITVASGTYNSDLSVSNTNCVLELLGDVTLQRIDLNNWSYVEIVGEYNLTVNNDVHVLKNSFLNIPGPEVFILASNNNMPINIVYKSYLHATKKIHITDLGVNVHDMLVQIRDSSFVSLNNGMEISDTTVNSNRIKYVILLSRDSLLYTDKNISIDISIISGALEGIICLRQESTFFAQGSVSITATTNCSRILAVARQSYFSSSGMFTSYGGSGSQIYADTSSVIIFGGGVDLTPTTNGSSSAMTISQNSAIQVFSSMKISGKISDSTVHVYDCGCFYLDPAVTPTGSPTVGKKFSVSRGGQIYVGGRGVNILPGANAGQIDNQITVKDTGNTNRTISMSYGYYG